MHPDERFISIVNEKVDWPGSVSGYFDTQHSSLNPYNQEDTPSFVYGTFPIFTTKAVATAAESDLPVISTLAGTFCERDGYDTTLVCGRRLTALTDTLTVLLVIALGAVLAGRGAGLLAGLLYACAVLPAQLSHFWTVDPWVVFFAVLTALLCVLWIKEPVGRPLRVGERAWLPWRRAGSGPGAGRTVALGAAIGVCVGLGLASKVTAWPLLLGPGVALLIRIGLRDVPKTGVTFGGGRRRLSGHWSYDVVLLSSAMLLGLLVFRVAQPYAFEGPHFWDMALNPQWRADIEREIDFQNGNVDFPPFVQFAGRTPFAWPLANMVLWGLGPALGLGAWLSAAALGVLAVRRRDTTWAIPLAIVLGVVGFQGPRFVAYMRYFAPAYPFLCLFAAVGVAWAGRAGLQLLRGRRTVPRLFQHRMRRRIAGGVLLAAAVVVPLLTAWWALAFQQIFREPHPRVEASAWIYENVPPGSSLTSEIWDDSLPYALPGLGFGGYEIVDTYPFDTDSVQKVTQLVYGRESPSPSAGLNGADYVVIASDRVRSAVSRLEREYPATIRYYDLLASGELGFELVAHFESRPSFLGISIDDSRAEESFTVYDHPEVWIYRKTEAWDPLKALNLLLEAHPERAVNLLPRQGRTNGLMFTAAESAEVQAAGTFSDVFDADGIAQRAPWAWWLLWMEVLALATLPAVTWLFRRLPDRGYGFSKLAGFAGVGLVAWLLVGWGFAEFSRGLAWGVFGAVVAGGAGLGYVRRAALREDLRTRWGAWLACEAVFLCAFGAFVLLRYELPDLWHNYQGGEKPIELAYLTAVTRSETLPPYDPWFAGGTMNYYYMGWFLAAVPMRAFRILPEVGFNLAIPTYAALAAATAFSTAGNLAALGRRSAARLRLRPLIWAGALGAVLLVGAGNLDAAQQAIVRFQTLNQAGVDENGETLYHWDLFGDVPVLGGAVGTVSGMYRWAIDDQPLPPFDWWRPSRAHQPAFDITEFPYFSFLFGDLHAHLMGIPFFGLVIALTLAYVVTADRDRLRPWALAAAMGVAVGFTRTVHTWDFPTAVVLTIAAIAAGQYLRRGPWTARLGDGLGHLVVAGAVAALLFAPYTQNNEVFETGIVRARETTRANQYFAHFGVFVVVAVAFLAVRYREELRVRRGDAGRNPFLGLASGGWEAFSLFVFLLGVSAFTWRWGLTTIALSIALLLFLGNLLWLESRAREPDRGRLFATALFAAAVSIAGGIDVVQVRYDIVRMNTVFKFSLQAWQLYALASAYGLWYVASALAYVDNWYLRVRPGRGLATAAAGLAIGLVLLGSSIYVWSGTRARLTARFESSPSGTLDGLAYLPYGYFGEDKGTLDPADDTLIVLADDAPIIEWLRENVEGTPVIAEAVGPLYHWTSRISWNTGLPTVVGWDWHEVAYRTDYEGLVQQRRLETQRFYTEESVAEALTYLRKYDVSYVVVGTTERVFSTPEGLQKFESMEALEPVFRSGEYVIYRVDKGRLGPATLYVR
jgi:YYY domain-containing protein